MPSFKDSSLAPDEVDRFSRLSGEWWNPAGAFRALHDVMPLRLTYIEEKIADLHPKRSLAGLSVLDMGCGGGLMAEALAERGARVTGVDASPDSIAAAQAHAQEKGLKIDYRTGTVEAFARGKERFDVILALEVVEHVADLDVFMRSLTGLLKPDGVIIVATLNRTKRSFLLGVVMAEFVLGWVKPGTHEWEAFVRPSEMAALWGKNGVETLDVTGMVYKMLERRFVLAKGRTAVNYFMTGKKRR